MADIVSNAKIYVDMSATPGGSPGAAILLDFADSLKDSDGRSVEVKTSIGKTRGAGFRRKAGGGSLTLSEHTHTPPQINWHKVKNDAKVFTIVCQDENGGIRQKYLKCTVSKVDGSKSAEGEHMNEIEIVYLDANP